MLHSPRLHGGGEGTLGGSRHWVRAQRARGKAGMGKGPRSPEPAGCWGGRRGVPRARWAAPRREQVPSRAIRLHNPRIVDSLGNFPGSTSCSEGGEMSDGGGWGLRGATGLGAAACPAGAEVMLGQVSACPTALATPCREPWGSEDSKGPAQPLPPGLASPGAAPCGPSPTAG